MRNFTFLSKNGNIPETVFSLKAAKEVAKKWSQQLNWEVMVVSYERTYERLGGIRRIMEKGKARNEGVADGEKFYTAKKGIIRKNGTNWGYILNKNLSPAPYLTGR